MRSGNDAYDEDGEGLFNHLDDGHKAEVRYYDAKVPSLGNEILSKVFSRSVRDKWSSKVSNFAIQYNMACVTLALAIMQTHELEKPDPSAIDKEHPQGKKPDFTQPKWVDRTLFMMVFVGSLVGMLAMGYVGDLIGVSKAMVVTTTISLFAALGSAFATVGDSLYERFVFFRFLLGVGVGGLYPLSAAQAAQQAAKEKAEMSTRDNNNDDVATKVGWNFFWQMPGNCSPYLVGLFLVSASSNTSFDFRTLIFLGAIPLLVVMLWNVDKVAEEERDKKMRGGGIIISDMKTTTLSSSVEVSPSKNTVGNEQEASPIVGIPLESATEFESPKRNNRKGSDIRDEEDASDRFSHRNLVTLVGTGGTWFLFDVAYYGTNCFTPFILSQIFTDDTLQMKCLKSLVTACFQIPATILGIYYLKNMVNLKQLNGHGFILMGIGFALFSLTSVSSSPWLRYFLLNFIFFSIAFGCTIATYILPTVLFAEQIRPSMHGISAAAGKAGAAAGALLYPLVVNDAETGKPSDSGLRTAMTLQCLVCAAGWAVNEYFIEWPPHGRHSRSDDNDMGSPTRTDNTPAGSTGAEPNPRRAAE